HRVGSGALLGGRGGWRSEKLAPRRLILPAPPAARLVTVVLLEQLVDTRAGRAEDTELLQVRAEPRPEPVVHTGLIDGARVHLEPVTELRVENPEGDRRRSGTDHGGQGDQRPSHRCSPQPFHELPGRRRFAAYRRVHPRIW